MKLKTLKDLPHYYDREGNKILLFEPHIKEEAIKWVKHSDKIANDPESPQDELRDFWMDRFNITEEDLK